MSTKHDLTFTYERLDTFMNDDGELSFVVKIGEQVIEYSINEDGFELPERHRWRLFESRFAEMTIVDITNERVFAFTVGYLKGFLRDS